MTTEIIGRPPVPPEWIRGPVDELAIAQGCWFDGAAGQFVCDFIGAFCRQSKGRWAGQPIRLLAWQRDFLMRFFGWKRADGLRRYRRFYIEIAKKNGKSTLVSALVIYCLLADGEPGPEIYCNACDRGQAKIIFDEAMRMVAASPELAKRLEVIESRHRIVDPVNNGAVIANSADAPNKDGFNPSHTFFDELHRQPNRDLWDVFEYASEAREQPVLGSISTAGEDESGVWHEQREYSERVNAGEIPDITHLGIVYRADPADDIDDPATWRKANPSMGEIIDEADFGRKLAEAKTVPTKLNLFRRLRLNIIAQAAAKYFSTDAWAKCDQSITIADLHGLDTYLGLDLSTIDDFSALAAIGRDDDGPHRLITRYWAPEDNLLALEQRTSMPYRQWADDGHLIATPGAVIDYEFIRREVVEIAEELGVKKILIDRYNAHMFTQAIREKDGLPAEFVQQGFLSLSSPTKELKRLMDSGQIIHDGNPITAWCIANAVAVEDDAGNVKLSKKKSTKKIDGAAAIVDALAGFASSDGEESDSIYNDQGFELL